MPSLSTSCINCLEARAHAPEVRQSRPLSPGRPNSLALPGSPALRIRFLADSQVLLPPLTPLPCLLPSLTPAFAHLRPLEPAVVSAWSVPCPPLSCFPSLLLEEPHPSFKCSADGAPAWVRPLFLTPLLSQLHGLHLRLDCCDCVPVCLSHQTVVSALREGSCVHCCFPSTLTVTQ